MLVLKHWLWLIVMALAVATCGGPAPEAASPTDAAGGGWVELGDDFVLDESAIDRVTPEPVEPESMSPAEAQAQLPFSYGVPAWAPAGYVLQEAVEVIQAADGQGYASVSLTWLNAGEAALVLRVAQAANDQPALGPAGSTEAVTVNGQPATLVHSSRLGAERLALTWASGDLTYTLTAEAGAATAEELRRMAESVG